MPNVRCWNCDAENDPVATSGVCALCGKRLADAPSAGIADTPGRPALSRFAEHDDRRLDRPVDPYRGRGGAGDEARKALNQSSGALFAVAALQAVCGLIALFALPEAVGVPAEGPAMAIVGAVIVGVAAVFAGLGVWARFMPLPATIIGLVLYVGITLFDLASAPELAYRGVIVKILIIVMLVKAIQAAAKYQRLMREREDRLLHEEGDF
jgi:hypothetical protein